MNYFGCYNVETSNDILVVFSYISSFRNLILGKNSAVISKRGYGFENLSDETIEMDLTGVDFYGNILDSLY